MRVKTTRALRGRRGLACLLVLLCAGAAACSPKPAQIVVEPASAPEPEEGATKAEKAAAKQKPHPKPGGRILLYGLNQNISFDGKVLDDKGAPVPGAKLDWASSNPKVLSMESAGYLKTKAAGKAIVTARLVGGELEGSANVEVVDLANVTISPSSTTLAGVAGSTFMFSVEARDTKGKVLVLPATWSSGAEMVAKVDSKSGTVTSVADGSAQIKAKVGDTEVSASLKVVTRELASLEMRPETLPLKIGESGKVTLVARDLIGTEIPDVAAVWSTSDPKVATCSGGVVLAIAPGSVTVRATCGPKTAEVSVLVF